ncbi:hypothetical protein J2Z49_002950, partial [Desulfofundulus luciae]|nr:hypothetical protein [Desulfofundulus luciae]MDQ0287817.1 hypothetical protein [Desulfofundulus luciae]
QLQIILVSEIVADCLVCENGQGLG